MIGAPPPCALPEERERSDDRERADDDESVEHSDRFLPQNVTRVTPELVEAAGRPLLLGRLLGREPEGELRVRALSFEARPPPGEQSDTLSRCLEPSALSR